MRRCSAKDRRQARRRGFCLLAVLVLTAGVLSLNRYVNTVVKPTLHELAEYEARAATVQAMNRAVAAELHALPALCDALFIAGLRACQSGRRSRRGRAGPICQRRADRDGRSAGDLLCRPVRQSDEQFTAERPWPRLAAVDPAQGLCAGGDPRRQRSRFPSIPHGTALFCSCPSPSI